MILSIDPGINDSGMALWDGGELHVAGLARSLRYGDIVPACVDWIGSHISMMYVHEIVIEIPQIYPMSRSKGDRNDLIELAFAAGRIVDAIGAPFIKYHPRQWKGQVPKEIHNRRVQATLTETERAWIEAVPKSLRHNVLDAIGLGQFHLKQERARR